MTDSQIVKSLACVLSRDEKAMKSELLVRCLEEKEGLEERKKSSADDFKRLITAKDCDVRKLTHEISTDIEYRDVECHEVMSFGRNQVDLMRTDTGEIVSSRTMRPEERQGALSLAGPGDDEEDGDDKDARAH
jgi:hypothetical protein